jgi:glycosyltransferase involved in cell wall biosynthesis
MAARQASQIHTVSEFSRQAILDLYRIPSDMVKIVPNGVDLQKFTPAGRSASVTRIAERLGLADYFLTVGRLEPRKNHCGLLNAYKMLKNEKPEVGPLVIVGQRDFRFKTFFQTVKALDLGKDVHVLENISDDLLPDVYRAARIFVYPSFAEGFGIPPLEAMACGVPVVSSNTTSMPEVIGEAGVLVDPARPEEIGAAMYKIIEDNKLAESLSALGRAQAEKWAWKNSARCYIDAIRGGFSH